MEGSFRRGGVAVVLLSYLALTVVFTYPLVRAPATTVEWGRGDPLLVAYIVRWGSHALFRQPDRLFDAPFLHPTRNTLSLSDHLLSVALPFSPLALLGRPLLLYNATVFASFFLSAAIFFAYLRRIGCGVFPAWLGGVLFAFMPWRYGQLGHAQLLYTWWIALTLLAIEIWIARPGFLRAAAVGFSFALVFEASVYHAYFLAFFLLGYLLVRLMLRTPDVHNVRPRTALLHVLSALAIAGALLLPSVLAYRRMAASLPTVNRLGELVGRGADILDYANPSSLPRLWGRFTRLDHPSSDVPWEMHLFPGALALAAAVLVPIALIVRRRTLDPPATAVPALAAGAFVCFLLSLGPVLHVGGRSIGFPMPYGFLHAHVPGFSALRVPARASFYVGLAGAALAAIGIQTILRATRSPRLAGSIRVAAAALALIDVAPHALPYLPSVEYDRLQVAMSAASPPAPGADLILPVESSSGYAAPLASAPLFRPIVNGVSGYLPPANSRIFEVLKEKDFGPMQSQVLRLLRVSRVLLDRTRIAAPAETAILEELSRAGAGPRSTGIRAGYHVVLLSWPRASGR